MRCDKKSMLLYAVTDRAWVGKKTLYEQVEAALKGGVTCVQLREKELSDDKFLDEAIRMKALCEKYNVPFIINDNVSVALKCGADGIHIGQNDMTANDVRAKIGDKMILGVSVQTVEQAIIAQNSGADYLGIGAVFNTSTKLDASIVSHEILRDICRVTQIPVVAIGGIYKHNILKLSGTGIDGVALVSAIFASENIEVECRELLSLSEQMVEFF